MPRAGVTLAEALEAGGIHHGVPGGDARAAMAAAAELLPLSPAERALAARMLTERERDCTTALGEGIAIPHPRSPLVFPTSSRSIAALCLLEKPVDFGAADGKPVGALFVILAPTVRLHLALLSQIAAALHQPDFRQAVTRQASAEEILRCLRERV